MKNKSHAFISFASAILLLSGCSEKGEYILYPFDFMNSSGSQSDNSSAAPPSSAFAPQPGSSESESSGNGIEMPETPEISEMPKTSEIPENIGKNEKPETLGESFCGAISRGGKLNVFKGEVLKIDEKAVCDNGGEIRIEKGGVLRLGGEIELNGDLYVQGKLIIEKDAKIGGSGVIHVISSFDDIECSGTVTVKIDAPEPVEKDGVTYVGDILLVNKKYSLPREFGSGLSDELTAAVEEMRRDSGFEMKISSGYRSYTEQEWWYNYWCSVDGERTASTYSAVPGHSEHQAGLAADITSSDLSYADTDEGKWLAENCYKYGLIIRYPDNKIDITGYIYEPWHVRFVGKSTAKLIHDSGLCLEEFLSVDG